MVKFNSDVPIDLIFSVVIPVKLIDLSLSICMESSFNLLILHKEISDPVSIKNVSFKFLPKFNSMKFVMLFDIWKT